MLKKGQGRTGPPGNLLVAMWTGWFNGLVGHHVKCWTKEWYWEGIPGPLFRDRVIYSD